MQGMERSSTSREGVMRNSTQSWLRRNHSVELDKIFRRIADVMQLPESILWPHLNAEMLQVVRYTATQVYDPHWDYVAEEPWDRCGGEFGGSLHWVESGGSLD